MFFKLLLIIVELIVIFYLLGFPILKRRPLFIREFSSAVITITVFSFLAMLSNPLFYLGGFALGLSVFFYSRTWIIVGLNIVQIKSALEKTLDLTRSKFEINNNAYHVRSLLKIVIMNAGGITLIRFSLYKPDRKTKLVKDVFRKFLQNYHIAS